MSSSEKRRFIAFCIVVVLLCICSAAYTCEVYGLMNPAGTADNIKEINIDGEDFTPVFKLGAFFVQGFVAVITLMSYNVFVLIVNVLLFLALRLITIRKAPYISKKEIVLTGKMIWSSLIVSFILSVVLTEWKFALTAASLFWQMPLSANLIYLPGLKSRYKKLNQKV